MPATDEVRRSLGFEMVAEAHESGRAPTPDEPRDVVAKVLEQHDELHMPLLAALRQALQQG